MIGAVSNPTSSPVPVFYGNVTERTHNEARWVTNDRSNTAYELDQSGKEDSRAASQSPEKEVAATRLVYFGRLPPSRFQASDSPIKIGDDETYDQAIMRTMKEVRSGPQAEDSLGARLNRARLAFQGHGREILWRVLRIVFNRPDFEDVSIITVANNAGRRRRRNQPPR
jgi:hypothetical protein